MVGVFFDAGSLLGTGSLPAGVVPGLGVTVVVGPGAFDCGPTPPLFGVGPTGS